MKFAIIAAGEGSRLREEGINVPKPLVRVNGEPLIDRLTRIFASCGAAEVVIIVNMEHPETIWFVRELEERWRVPVRVVIKSTPSSMHSFYELSPYLTATDKFCLTTVDTIFREEEFKTFVKAFQDSDKDGMMAVTDFIDDEKPLYISTDETLRITGFHDTATENCRYISGGIYGLTPKAIQTLERCMKEGKSRMRNFQRALIEDGLALQAYPFLKILDVDHASDIEKAELFLQDNEQSR